jgi:hypothetical protein
LTYNPALALYEKTLVCHSCSDELAEVVDAEEKRKQKIIHNVKKLTPEERFEVCVHADKCPKNLKCSDVCKNRPDRLYVV